MNRKEFLTKATLLTFGMLSAPQLLANKNKKILKTNNLIKDINGILDLPKDFSYKIISRENDLMDDGLTVPTSADGMACFQGNQDKVILIRNHEIGHVPNIENFLKSNPLGPRFLHYIKDNGKNFYDIKNNKTQCFGGTTNIIYNTKLEKVELQYLSLGGTLVNCSGGSSPWNTWLSCEETVKKKGAGLNKNHGYVFEVYPYDVVKLTKAVPLKSMGRFRREAIAFDISSGYIYQTEDRERGLLYRFIPKNKQKLFKGGVLQALSIEKMEGIHTSNWKKNKFILNKKYKVKWIDLKNINSPNDTLRHEGKKLGCNPFARGEGIYYHNNNVYFTCTNGGNNRCGQIWKYSIGDSSINLFYESDNSTSLNMPDNLIISPWGDIIVCEDGKGRDRLVGIKPNGAIYYIASNALNNSEFAGATFSPDGNILFVNIYDPTLTIAIKGPWKFFYN